jgi:hypothetical protein
MALDGEEWSASRFGRFTPEKSLGRPTRTGGWVGPRARLDVVVKRMLLVLVGFQVLTAANMKIAVFWVVAPCSLVEVY